MENCYFTQLFKLLFNELEIQLIFKLAFSIKNYLIIHENFQNFAGFH